MEAYCSVCNVLCGDEVMCYNCVLDEKHTLSEIHIKELQSKLASHRFQSDNQHSEGFGTPDVKIVVQDERDGFVYAQKHILSTYSPIFCKMFEETDTSEETEMVYIADASLPAMRAVVKFCYSGEINFTVSEVTAEDLLDVAHMYQIRELQSLCEEFLLETLTHGNLVEILKLARKSDETRLEAAAIDYLRIHYDTLISFVLDEFC